MIQSGPTHDLDEGTESEKGKMSAEEKLGHVRVVDVQSPIGDWVKPTGRPPSEPY